MKNTLKEKLNANKPTFGPFVGFPSPQIVEMLGWLGFDFVIIDCEHGVIDYESAESMIRAAEVSGTTPIVRVGMNEAQHIQRFLEAGAHGIMIPLINDGELAKKVVDAVKYPPMGKRGAYSGRNAHYGLRNFAEYIQESNEQTLVVLQIETLEAIENQEAIIAAENADMIFFGPNDLSINFGKIGQTGHPEVVAAIEKMVSKTLAAGKHCGTLAGNGEEAKFWHDRGVNWLVGGVGRYIAEYCRDHINEMRDAVR